MTRPAFAALGLAAIGLLAASAADAASARREAGAVRFYDDKGQDRGYAWCLKKISRWEAGWSDCSYVTEAQCRATLPSPTASNCEPNPFSINAAPRR